MAEIKLILIFISRHQAAGSLAGKLGKYEADVSRVDTVDI